MTSHINQTHPSINNTIRRWAILKRFLFIYTPTVLLIASISGTVYYLQFLHMKNDIIKTHESGELIRRHAWVNQEIDQVISDTHFLSLVSSLQQFIKKPTESARSLLQSDFLSFSKQHIQYDQVRFLDKKGMEIIRVNQSLAGPVSVPRSELQAKGSRYYFRDTFVLSPGEMFMSPLDLNIERGSIEIPFKPMIRFGTIVTDESGKKAGIIIINYNASALLSWTGQKDVSEKGNIYWANSDGAWLNGPDSESEWGFMFPARHKTTVKDWFPEAWENIKAGSKGEFHTPLGWFSYQTIYPLRQNVVSSDGHPSAYAPSTKQIINDEYHWFLISFISGTVLKHTTALFYKGMILVDLILLLAGGFGAWFLAVSQERRLLAEKASHLDRYRFRGLFEQSHEGVAIYEVITDVVPGFVLVDMNDAGEKAAGVQKSDMIGKRLIDFFPEAEESGLLNTFQQVWASGLSTRHDFSIIRNRYAQWFETQIFKVSPNELVTVFADTSLRKRNQEALERLVAERTKALSEANTALSREIKEHKAAEVQKAEFESRLRHTQKLEAIGTLAGGIAHDFNNILSAILGYSELALDDIPENSITRENIKQVVLAGIRARDLVLQILTFSRQTDQDREPVRLCHVVDEALKLLRASLPSTITISTDIINDTNHISADPTQMHQVVMNLCTNAAQAMPDGGLLSVGISQVIDPGDGIDGLDDLSSGPYTCLHVADSGHGIPDDILERVFEPFFTTKGVGKGTGMGLSVVHGIVKAHGGRIRVTSSPGEGTSFRLYFPQIDADAGVTVIPDESVPGGSERILFVDDEIAITNAITQILSRLGYRVDGMIDSHAALAALETRIHEYDLLITDLTMPNINGLILAAAARRLKPRMPVILCSGNRNSLTDDEIEVSEADAILFKPIARVELAQTIREVLDKASFQLSENAG